MPFFDPIRIGASGVVDTAFSIDRSLRFDQNDAHKLTRTFGTATSNTTKTLSFWMKRGRISTSQIQNIFCTALSGMIEGRLRINTDDTLHLEERDASGGTSDGRRVTTQVFRDVSAWYHIVLALDSTQSTEIDRAKIYVNGSQVTDFSSTRDISQNYSFSFFRASADNYVGDGTGQNDHFDGYLTEINFIDGQALTPSSFGETNASTGQWVPIDTSGLTFGNNGFRLNFSDNSSTTASTLGKDTSGNGNNFTPDNFGATLVDSFTDTPTLNYPTLNPLDNSLGTASHLVYSNGNLQVKAASGVWASTRATFAVSSGKWYWEVKILSADSLRPFIGVIESDVRLATNQADQTNELGVAATSIAYWTGNSYIRGGANTSGTNTNVPQSTTNDIVGVALDMDNKKVYFSKNGTFFASQDPANNTGEIVSFSTSMQSASISPAVQAYNNANETAFNFGQQAFSYTPPTGYKKLNSDNLPTPTIIFGNKHFEPKLYTPNSGNLSVTGYQFQPDWIWLKSKAQNYRHYLFDSVRGTGQKAISSNLEVAEGNDAGSLTSFDSTGWTTSGSSGFNDNGSGTNGAISYAWNAGDTDGKTYTVTVVSDSGNKFRFDGYGTSAVTLDLAEGGTYIFNYPSAHPFRFSTTSDGTHGGGSEYTTGVTVLSTTSVQIVVAASAPQLYYFCTQHSGMGGAINTNSTSGSSNFDGTTQAVVKANPTAGFAIVTYTGTGSLTTIGHGLGAAPKLILTKSRSASGSWGTLNVAADPTAESRIHLNDNGGYSGYQGYKLWGDTVPTSSVFTVREDSATNASGVTYVAYVFSPVEGYSKIGTYRGSGTGGNGRFVFTGFKPAFVILKNYASENWLMLDSGRNPFNPVNERLFPDTGLAYSNEVMADFLSNGFKSRNGGGAYIISDSSSRYLYWAFAESPFKFSRAV